MTTDFPSKELLEVIRSQARMEEKLDSFLKNSTSMQAKLSSIESDVAELKAKRREDKAYIAALSAVFSVAFAIILPVAKKFFGI
jgi:peptidoglycan hydrolase CwlO-like protein